LASLEFFPAFSSLTISMEVVEKASSEMGVSENQKSGGGTAGSDVNKPNGEGMASEAVTVAERNGDEAGASSARGIPLFDQTLNHLAN
jgi:hypothetical protein